MADENKMKAEIEIVGKVNKKKAEQAGADLAENVRKGVGNNGYIELPVKIKNYKYPERTKSKSGIMYGRDYSELQKAQDKLISNWNKLSKKGFSSREEDVLEALKSYKQYKNTVKKQYGSWENAEKDSQYREIESIMRNQVSRYFSRLLDKVDVGGGKKDYFMNTEDKALFEKYAKQAIKMHKAAKALNIDLSKDEPITKEMREKISKKVTRMEQSALIKERQKQVKYEQEHAEEIKKEEEKTIKQIESERKKRAKKAIEIPKFETDTVELTATKVENLAKPTGYQRTPDDIEDDEAYMEAVESGARNRKTNTPTNDVNLGIREQNLDPTYLFKDFLQQQNRLGTYTGTNSLIRQTMQNIPEQMKKSIESLVKRIDKDEALKTFNQFDKSEKAQWSKLANETGMRKLLLTNVAKVQNALMAGKEGVTPEDLKNAIVVALADAVENGTSQIAAENYKKGVFGITSMLMSRYSNMKDMLGFTGGEERGVGVNYKEVENTLKEVFDDFEKTATALMDRALEEFSDFYNNGKNRKETTFSKIFEARITDSYNTLKSLLGEIPDVRSEIASQTSVVNKNYMQDIRESSRKRSADTAEGKKNQDIINAITKLDSDVNMYALVSILEQIRDNLQKTGKRAGENKSREDLAKSSGLTKEESEFMRNTLVKDQLLLSPPKQLDRSQVLTSIMDPSKTSKLQIIFEKLTGTTENYEKIMSKVSEEQDALNERRIREYGINTGRFPAESGDKIRFARSMSLWRGRDKFGEMFKNFKITPGIKVDTTEITKALARVLSGPEMFKAQTGGWKNNLMAGATGGLAFLFQPSLEKSRAQADAVNTIMADIRENINAVLQDILDKESKLSPMEKRGDIMFNEDGSVLRGTTEAKTLAAQLEESKLVLASLLADMGMVNEVVGKTGGKLSKVVKQLGFTAPLLRKDNAILANINAGLDKTGKALKFQRRSQEIINYTFQLMGRHMGQLVKNWMMMLNPLSAIKKAFNDFASYDIKWQRTMNVIKYNLRSILKPIMQWIAQQLVNIIGFLDIISMRIQKAFGKVPVSLFDQVNADLEKMEEEIQNVTAGFDEFHDIGSDNSGANDLLGEIYKPQLSEEWKKFAETVGDVVGNISKYVTEHWAELLDKLLMTFLAWKLLKLAGKLLWGSLFGDFTGSAIGRLFKNVGNWIWNGLKGLGNGLWNLLGLTTFGQQMQVGFLQAFQGQGLIGAIKGGGASLGSVFAQAFLAVAGLTIATAGISYFGNKADKNSAYNYGLMEMGGDEKDKKSNFWNGVGATLFGAGGGALTGLAVGGPIGAAIGAGIGAIAGTLRTVLSPVIEEVTIKANEMNNEMQKVELYEGRVQGINTQVSELDQLLNVLNQTLQTQTQNVYKQGEELGISKTRMEELVTSIQKGTFSTDMLSGKEIQLTDSLVQLNAQQEKVNDTTTKLTEAKKKLEKAELDLAIAQDIEAGNFEMAAARVEYAMASELYETDEAVKKMTQIIKKGSAEQQAAMLKDMSPEMRKNFDNYYLTTAGAMNELYKLYDKMSEKERQTWLQNINGEIAKNITNRMEIIRQRVQNSSWWQQLLDFNKNGKILGISYIGHDIPGYATGTNYVPNDGLAYLHQGEAVIPKKYNQPYNQGMSNEERSYMQQMMMTMRSLDSTMKQGINVNGQFVQRGSDLVAVVNRTNSQTGSDLLSNVSYAR